MPWASRGVALALVLLSVVAAWASWTLEVWTFMGPGPGLFPLMVSGVCVLLAVVVACAPAPQSAGRDEDGADAAPLGPNERRSLAMHVAALVALAVGTAWLGLWLTCVLLCLIVIHFGERRPLGVALLAGVLMGLVGVVLFGWLLQVEIPAGYPEQLIYQWLR